MDRLPTLLIVAEEPVCTDDRLVLGQRPFHQDAAMSLFGNLRGTLQTALESKLPSAVIAPKDVANQARKILPGNCVIDLPQTTKISRTRGDRFVAAVANGILGCANANGWIILPAQTPMLSVATLQKIANTLPNQSIVYPRYRLQQGLPVAFSAELFSELIRLQTENDLCRLMCRYPITAVDVEDPGVLLCATPHNRMPNIDAPQTGWPLKHH